MQQAVTPEEKFNKMTQTPIPKLILTMAIPTMITMVITSIYNMADTYFVGKISTSASGAVGIALSLMAIIQSVGFTLGMGSGNYISRLLGQRESEKASQVAAISFYTALGFGAIITVLGLIFLDPLVRLLGATPTILPHAREYVRYILIGAPLFVSSFVLNNLLRYQGSAFYSMIGIGVGGLLNIALDPIFIFTLNMGTGGAALATIISQAISFILLLFGCGRGGNIKISLGHFKPQWSVYKEILNGGLPSFFRQSFASVANILLNHAAATYGDAAIAAMSIVGRVLQFATSLLLGFGQGFQPVCGFNYGAKLYGRVRKAFWFCIKVAVVALVIMATVGFIFAPQIIAQFRKDDLEVIAIGTTALRFQCITFPLSSWIIINNMLLQTIGEAKKASLIVLARQGLFFIPLILILPGIAGVLGIQISQPLSDIATFILAIPLGLSVLKNLKQMQIQEEASSLQQEAVS